MLPSKLKNRIDRLYGELIESRNNYLNNGVFWKIFFARYVPVETNLQEIYDFIFDDAISNLPYFSHSSVIELDTKMVEWAVAQAIYSSTYDKYESNNLDISSYPNCSIHPLNTILRKTLDALKLAYVTNFNIYSKNLSVARGQKPTFNFEYSLKVDVYGHFVFKRKIKTVTGVETLLELNPFAIICLENSNAKSKLNAFLKTYFLKQLNIHVLILNSDQEIIKHIATFFKAIKSKRNHICQGVPKINLKQNVNLGPLLNKFRDAYSQGRIALYKLRDDDILTENIEIDIPIAKVPQDQSYSVDGGLLKSLVKTHTL
jgi:hypothetical protein